MRPSVSKLLTKLKRLESLKTQPDSVPYLLEQVAHHYFVHERERPSHAFENFIGAYRVWQAAMGYPSMADDTRNDRQLEMASNLIATEDEFEKLSLGDPSEIGSEARKALVKSVFLKDGKIVDARNHSEVVSYADTPNTTIIDHEKGCWGSKGGPCQCGARERWFTIVQKQRNNTTPGPSHKSPVAYKMTGETGFTIPGYEGAFVWRGPGREPDMGAVVKTVAAGLIRGRSPDLEDKGLKKRIRKIIEDHHLVLDVADYNSLICNCTEDFVAINEWASHVRKLIWKELKTGGESDPS